MKTPTYQVRVTVPVLAGQKAPTNKEIEAQLESVLRLLGFPGSKAESQRTDK